MLLPWSHDTAPLARRPWVTLGLISACVITLVVTQLDPAVGHFERTIGEAHTYWSAHPYLEPGGLLADTFGDAGAEARREFQASLEAGDVPIPRDAVEAEQAELDRLTTAASAALERHVWHRYGLVPAAPRAEGILGHLFLHAGWLHLIGNLVFLLLTGPFLEARWGRLPYLLFYLGAGVAAAALFTFQHPYGMGPLIGASGAIAGTMGAFLVVFATVRIRFAYWLGLFWGTFAVPAWLMLPLWFAHELATARLMDLAGTSDGVAYWAHVGGFAFGAVAAGILKLTGADAALAGERVPETRPASQSPAAAAETREPVASTEPQDASWNLWAAVGRADRSRALREWQGLRSAGLEPSDGSPDATVRLAGWLAAQGDTREASALLGQLLPRADLSVAERIAGVAGRIDPELARRAAERVAAARPPRTRAPEPPSADDTARARREAPAADTGPARHQAPAAFALGTHDEQAPFDTGTHDEQAQFDTGTHDDPAAFDLETHEAPASPTLPPSAPSDDPESESDALFGLESDDELSAALSGLDETPEPASSPAPLPARPASSPGAGAPAPESELFETDALDLAAKEDDSWSFDESPVALDAPGSHAADTDAELFDRDAIDLGPDDE